MSTRHTPPTASVRLPVRREDDAGSRPQSPTFLMSTTQTAQPERTVNPDDAFERYIWYNSECCSNCFARVRIVYEDVPQRGLSATPRTSSYRTEDAGRGHDSTDHDDYGAIRTYEPATTCENCGSVRLLSHHDTMSAAEMIDTVDALVDRLDEQGIDCHAEAVRRLIGRAKAKTTVQGGAQDRLIFERATAFGIRWARRHV